MIKFSKSPRINNALYDMGLFSYKDIINYLPRKYDNFEPTHEDHLVDKERVTFVGHISSNPVLSRFRSVSVTKFMFATKSGHLFYVEAWNRPYIASTIKLDETYTLTGNYDAKKDKINLIALSKGEITNGVYLKPVYSLHKDLEQFEFIRLVKKAFEEVDPSEIKDEVPGYFNKKYRLLSKYEALKLLHNPKNPKDVYNGLRVFKYYECLLFSLKNQLIRNANKLLTKTEKNHIDIKDLRKFLSTLPYELTQDQKDATNDIIKDMNSKSLMYRLLQGDVGTGKTLVSLIALYANYLRGDQGALMAPTDALARQHYKVAKELFKNTPLRICLLTGSLDTKNRAEVRSNIRNGAVDLVIGTHALFSKDIDYMSLGLVVIDEQHKFGVNQRATLASKGEHADLLLMSATPIPRTLALTLYGDLDVTTISMFPFKERTIETKIVKDDAKELTRAIEKSLANDKRIFIVAPLIDEGEDKDKVSAESLFAKYLLKYPGKVTLMHGRLDDDEKLFAINDFIQGVTPILISTTVIEVGIDVKNADLIIVYDPTHFGLASLHQLRGRVGRDGSLAHCYLVYNDKDEDELDKLNVLVNSNDGFFIAEEDLRRRGPGELAGIKQSGVANFNYVNLSNDFKIFVVARDDATFILDNKDEVGFKKILNVATTEINKNN